MFSMSRGDRGNVNKHSEVNQSILRDGRLDAQMGGQTHTCRAQNSTRRSVVTGENKNHLGP